MIADALGNPLNFTLTGAEQADITQAVELINAVKDPGAVIADKGYDADALVEDIKRIGAEPIIPPRRNRNAPRTWDKDRYRARHLVENLFARLKQFRRLATRYDKLARHFAAFVVIASLFVWLV
jgi:transposase